MLKAGKKGQSTLEYITVFMAVIAVIVMFAHAALRPSVQDVVNASADRISNASEVFNSAITP